ncbi:MAG: Gfo/Idh/MocA family protein [Pyrinomonadaceae bacterium]
MSEINRRDFTKAAVAASTVTALSYRRVIGANERVGVGIIGCGGRGFDVWKRFVKQPDVNAVAVCDVYEPFVRRGVAASQGGAIAHKDFRQVLDMRDVDAVIVATPDHWHALQTVMACRAGKDVYVEKPLSLTIGEGRVMVDEARKHNRVVQVGSQQRSGAHYAKAVKLIREGAIGDVHHVSAGMTRNAMPGFVARELRAGLTKELDWDMWLGPAPERPFDPFRCIYHFRWFWDYSGGQMTNWGAHHLDIARWALNAKAPTIITGLGGRYAIKDGGETPDVQEVLFDFPGSVVTWTSREINQGRDVPLEFHGTKGTLSITRRGFSVKPEVWTGQDPSNPDAKNERPAMEPIPNEPGGEMDDTHVRNFLDCVRSRQRPNADIEEGHLTAVMCHAANISTRLKRSLRWDANKEQFVNDREANQFLSKPYRKAWKLA